MSLKKRIAMLVAIIAIATMLAAIVTMIL